VAAQRKIPRFPRSQDPGQPSWARDHRDLGILGSSFSPSQRGPKPRMPRNRPSLPGRAGCHPTPQPSWPLGGPRGGACSALGGSHARYLGCQHRSKSDPRAPGGFSDKGTVFTRWRHRPWPRQRAGRRGGGAPATRTARRRASRRPRRARRTAPSAESRRTGVDKARLGFGEPLLPLCNDQPLTPP